MRFILVTYKFLQNKNLSHLDLIVTLQPLLRWCDKRVTLKHRDIILEEFVELRSLPEKSFQKRFEMRCDRLVTRRWDSIVTPKHGDAGSPIRAEVWSSGSEKGPVL